MSDFAAVPQRQSHIRQSRQGINGAEGASVRHLARGAVVGGLGEGMPLDSENETTVSIKVFRSLIHYTRVISRASREKGVFTPRC